MDLMVYIVPTAIVLFLLVRQAWQIWKDGLFMALLQLGIALVSSVLAFCLTRLLLDPAKVDLFGLGALLVKKIPADFFVVLPRLEAFMQALPTALAALIFFPVFFDLLRIIGNKLLRKLNRTHQWSEKCLKIKAEKPLSILAGLLIAAVCLMVDLVTLTGTLTFSGNMLYCAEAATGEQVFSTMGNVVHRLQRNPVIRLSKALGAEELYFELTTASRDGQSFSVGQEMNELSTVFVGILPVFDALPREGQIPTPEQIRALPEALGSSDESLALTVGLVRSYRQELGDSDAVLIMSTLTGTTPERFEQYLAQLTEEQAREDLATFCEIAAILGDRGLIPESGDLFDLNALSDPQLLAEARQILSENQQLSACLAQ